MTSLVEDLLASARRAAPAFAETDLDLGWVAREAAEEYQLLARDTDVRLSYRLEPGLVVLGDAQALRRAVDNLLSNAVRVAPPGSEVVLAAGRRDGWCWIAVRDEGPGIEPADRERVFDRFWRAESTRSAVDRRTGLGLAIVRQILEGHGGSVALHSEVEEGSTFVLWLPAAGIAGPRSATPPAVDPLS